MPTPDANAANYLLRDKKINFTVGPLQTIEQMTKAARVWEIANSSNYKRPVAEDIDALAARLVDMASRPCNYIPGVTINDDVIGVGVFCNGVCSMMGVLPEWHGFGLGKRLIMRRQGFARGQGWGRITTTTALWNRRVQALYESLGWERNGPAFEYLDANRSPMVMYEKALNV